MDSFVIIGFFVRTLMLRTNGKLVKAVAIIVNVLVNCQ